MVGFEALWLPVLLSAVVVFVLSAILHMATPWHKGDYRKLPQEDKVLDALRPFGIPPGDYMAPRASSMAEWKSPAFEEKLKKGPVLVMTVMPSGASGMGASLALWFLFSIIVGVFAAYVTGRALPPGASYLEVFRFVGVTAFLGYSLALWEMSIWYKRSWVTSLKSTVDGLIYALFTAGVFGWLWPRG